jgi:hypothetical protein
MVSCAYIADVLAAHKLLIPLNERRPPADASEGLADAIYVN